MAHVHKFVPKRQPGRPRKGREGKGEKNIIVYVRRRYYTIPLIELGYFISSLWRLGTKHVAARA